MFAAVAHLDVLVSSCFLIEISQGLIVIHSSCWLETKEGLLENTPGLQERLTALGLSFALDFQYLGVSLLWNTSVLGRRDSQLVNRLSPRKSQRNLKARFCFYLPESDLESYIELKRKHQPLRKGFKLLVCPYLECLAIISSVCNTEILCGWLLQKGIFDPAILNTLDTFGNFENC